MQSKFKQLFFAPLSYFGISYQLQSTALWSMLESFSSPFFAILLIPILTKYLGLDTYGIYVMVMAFVSFFSFTGLGMNTSITYFLATNYKSSNSKEIARRIITAIAITFFFTIFFSLIFLLILNFFATSLNTYFSQLVLEERIIHLGLALIVITQLDAVVSASLKGLQYFKISSQCDFLLRFVAFLLITYVAITEKSIFYIIFISLIMTFISLVVRFTVLTSVVRFDLSDLRYDKAIAYELFGFGKWMTLQSISSAFFSSFDKLLIGSVLGHNVVAVYNILVTVSQLIHFIPANMLVFIMPLVAKNNKIITIYLLKKLFVLTATLSILVAIFIYASKSFLFLKFKINSEYNVLFYWLIFNYVLLSLNIPSYYLALAQNLIKYVSLQCIVGSIAGLFTLVMFISSYGLFGAVASKLIFSFVAISLVIPVLTKIKKDTRI